MTGLPPRIRQAIQAVKLDGLSVREAAEQCGMSESNVKVSVHRGLKALALQIRKKGRNDAVYLPILVVGFAGVVALTREPTWAACKQMVLGTEWATCAFCIPLFAIIPFVALIWALRQGAPTNLTRTGAIAGLVAGALGAAAYAFHCPDDSLPFIAIWYGAMVMFCAWIGARLGPWLLRW